MIKKMSATKARIILSAFLFLILAGMGAGFYIIYSSFLKNAAQDIANIQSEAQSSDAKLQQLIQLESKMNDYRPISQRAKQVVIDSSNYQYQNRVISDLSRYAEQANVGITSFNFKETADSGKQDSSSSQDKSDQTAETNSDENKASTTSSTPAGVKNVQVSVQLSKNVRFNNFLHFLYLIEQNLTRIQVMDLSFNRDTSTDSVSAQTLNLEVYVK